MFALKVDSIAGEMQPACCILALSIAGDFALHISGCVCLQDEESPDASPEQTPETTPSSAHPTPGTTRDTTPEAAKGSGSKQKRAEKEAAGLEATDLVRTSFLQFTVPSKHGEPAMHA